MQNTTTQNIQKKFQGAQTSLFTTVLAKTPVMNSSSMLKGKPSLNKGSKQHCIAPSRVMNNQGMFVPLTRSTRSNQTRLMATPMMSAQIKNTSATKTANPNLNSASV